MEATAASSGKKESAQPSGFRAELQEAISLADYRPRPAADVAVRQQDDVYVLKNPHAGTYMRLSPEEYTLWTWMDGQRTVRELAVDYFLRHQRFVPVAELVRRLRQGSLLADPPTGIRTQLQEAAQRQEEPGGRRVLNLLWGHPVVLRGTDRFFRTLYRLGGRILFMRPAILIQRLIALIGFVAFVVLLLQGRQGYEILQAGQSYPLGLLLLLLLNIVTLSLHESAHALATIHNGCEVRRGGFMLYLGLPTLFVDTTDTWMVGKEGRIQVAMAGPWNDLVVGGLCALLSLPQWGGAPLLLKIATLAYISAFFNLNPLLELDGYYILSDTLEMPYLRRDALAFVGRDLWERLRQRQSLSPRERLYAAYGLLALAYLVVVAGLVVLFWRTQVTRLVADLLQRGPWGQIFLGFLAAGVGGPLVALVGRRLYRAGRRAWQSLAERGVLTRGTARLVLVAGVSLALTILFRLLPLSWQQAGLPVLLPLLHAVALAALVATLPFYKGTPFRWVLLILAGVTLILGLGGAMEGFRAEVGVGTATARLAQIGTLLVALTAFSAEDLVRARALERIVMAMLLGGGFILAVTLASEEILTGSLTPTLWVAGPVFLGGLALSLLVPTVISFAGTPFAPSWVLFSLGLALSLARCALETQLGLVMMLDLGIAFLMAQGAVLYLLAQRYLQYRAEEGVASPAPGTRPMLRQAFAHFFEGFFHVFRDTFGRHRAQVLDDRLDIIAVTANWLVAVDGGRIREGAEVAGYPLEELAAQYTDLLEQTVEIMDDLAGRPFLRRAIQSAYDSLPWSQREVLAHWVLSQTPWGEAVSRQFFSRQGENLRLLARVPLFFGCDETTLTQVRAALREERVRAGQVIVEQGDLATSLWIVVSGEIEVWQEDAAGRRRLLDELHRGDSFGEHALLEDKVYQATYQASVETSLLRVEGVALERALQDRPFPPEEVRTRARLLAWLAGLPLFQGLPWRDLQTMAGRLKRRQVPAWEVVVHEKDRNNAFHLIEGGKVLAISGWGSEAEEIRGELGPGEYFGEIPPFLEREATATVLTTEPSTFWLLPAEEFRRFLEQCLTY